MTKGSGRVAAGIGVALAIASPAAAQTGQPASAHNAPVIRDTGSLKGPRQPIFFRHDVHAGQYGIACLYCHATVTVSSEPGIPAVQTCFGCHQLIGGGKRPPEWVRVHAVPGFVHFPHMRHIKALGTDSCINCHGDVRAMPQVYQVSTLRMGWCVNCHVQRQVSRDCTLCHY